MAKIIYQEVPNEGILKIRKTKAKSSRFKFQGDMYSVSLLYRSKIIKMYHNEHHLVILLVKDIYNRLFFNVWYEEMQFGGEDLIQESFSLVNDQDEADRLFEGKLSMYNAKGYVPFICWTEDDFVRIYERAGEAKKQSKNRNLR